MPANSPIAALPYFINSDAPSIPLATQNLATALDKVVVPRFATATVRDNTIASGQRTQGLRCYIDGSGEWEYDGAAWMPMGPRIVSNRSTTSIYITSSTVPVQVAQLNVAFTSTRQRMYRASALYYVQSNVVNDTIRFTLTMNAANVLVEQDTIQVINTPAYRTATSVPFILAAGTWTPGAAILQAFGSGNSSLQAGAQLVITDEGPA